MNPLDKLSSLSAQLSQIYAQWAKQYNLTLNELRFLYHINAQGSCSPSEIGDKWSLPKQTVTSVCKQLSQKGFLRFSPDHKDKRAKRIELTPAGLAFTQPMIENLIRLEYQASADFDQEKITLLLTEIERWQAMLNHYLNNQ
ncbi:DNA-binding MarR family transcriptional regulator [Mesocricetibacter intestinalis]|uniref:DNA-binding MarR family transcriptional regulator n=1 Tax=Mesocricetibacter intestinalis TaxID=1521930 RepID=A0A4R6VLU0_9PAST|nr:MarR family transcriptional regulator [Mesocricetibacter intestinalis]TDQ59800.1 DNA-binding MarR family transcriptional regulator [Mesocricetibacter intestinalis]